MLNPISCRYAIVTGAASGLGRAIALRLASEGWHLALADINLEGCRETASLVEQSGVAAHVEPLDVTQIEAWKSLVTRLQAEWPRLDLLVNNAGVACAGEIGALELADWHWAIDINLFGAIYGCHACRDWLVQNPHGGHILNVASAAAIVCAPAMGPYNVSKAGVVALSKTLYAELRSHGVGVTVLCPGLVATNLLDGGRFHRPEQQKTAARLMQAARLTPDDVARAALRAIARQQLYVVLPARARLFWWLRRLWPTTMMKLVAWIAGRDDSLPGHPLRNIFHRLTHLVWALPPTKRSRTPNVEPEIQNI